MQKVLTAVEMREVDRRTVERCGIPSLDLMENAARSVLEAIDARGWPLVVRPKVLVICGKGNNGGDGAALARLLWLDGADVEVLLLGSVDDTRGDARTNFERLTNLPDDDRLGTIFFHENAALDPRTEADVVVDAVFGTGLTRAVEDGLRDELASFYAQLPKTTLRVAVDMPSGLFADSCEVADPAKQIAADMTVTFTAPKLANILPPASNFNGELVVADIGSPRELILEQPSRTFVAEAADAREWLVKTEFSTSSYKNKRGHALIVAGSREYSGAAVLAGNAAMVSGTGLVTVATPNDTLESVAARILPEIIVRGADSYDEIAPLAGKCDAALIGCGLSLSDAKRALVREVVENRETPLVLDADALNALSPFELDARSGAPLILTPHEGEFKRLSGLTGLGDRVESARTFATRHGVYLVLKGERTLVVAPDGRVVVNPTGNSGLGKAGNGDTLAGFIAGCLAQASAMKVDIFETLVASVYIAGLAGDIAATNVGKRTMRASDVRESIADAFRSLA